MATEERLIGLALVLVLGIGAQWLAWRLRLPSILLLLLTGFIAGPITGVFNPDEVFGGLLFPLVSLAVAIILFEGGLTLRLAELPKMGGALFRLLSLGALITWIVGTLAAKLFLGFDWGLSLLLGAIMIVTGPTVVGPLLRHVRPTSRVASLLNWEGIVIDPIGAVAAVLVFEALVPKGSLDGFDHIAGGLARTLFWGVLIGIGGAGILAVLLRRFWIPDNLQNPAALAFVAGAFALSNHFQHESGLLAVTLMGVALANQKWIAVKHIVEFKENLRVLLISGLFILLAARLTTNDLKQIGFGAVAFLVIMVFVARPLSVWISTLRSPLSTGEKVFTAWMAPRGIVAASVASIFALRLQQENYPGAEQLVPVTVVVIAGTVALYGLTASLVANKLGIAKPRPNGVLIVGAHASARHIAEALKNNDVPVLLVDSTLSNIMQARVSGLPVLHASIGSQVAWEHAEEGEFGRLLALTSNDEVNSLACLQFIEIFGRAGVFQLLPKRTGHSRLEAMAMHQRGRLAFDGNTSFATLEKMFEQGATVKTVKLKPGYDFKAFRLQYGASVLPLFVIDEEKKMLHVAAPDSEVKPAPGHTLIALVPRGKEISEAKQVAKQAAKTEKNTEKDTNAEAETEANVEAAVAPNGSQNGHSAPPATEAATPADATSESSPPPR